ncbi:error-prone DNA polymerase [Oleiagrimonas sp. C23AA]|uniref:error-prone DNA polymerase n=1 Tax=Oleiagrimonas sp. C23AA TaxID=2719047 RepID=UPI0014206EFC|nr:error-prone DNA polymerase [Oleiagrimonas sp. C23AA]NII10952.1 error-prone DNA polymerase [Oleiagrimonas sp. C23AA]
MNAYAELHCLSDFSFQRGASHAMELFERARDCGYSALAITDECSLAGIVRALEASQKTGVKLIVGAEIRLDDGPALVLLCESREGYSQLCRLITRGRRASEKGRYRLSRSDVSHGLAGTLALWIPPADTAPSLEHGQWMKDTFGERCWLAVELHKGPDDQAQLRRLQQAGQRLDMPLVAAGDVHMHVRRRLPLQHTMTAIRHRTTVAQAGALLFNNGERHLRRREALASLYPAELLAQSVAIAQRCHFDLGQDLGYRYPEELVPAGHTPDSWLRHLVEEGKTWRWPQGTPDKVGAQIEQELALIQELAYASYFLTVHDIVSQARRLGILCQGRGSAANSAVCFALGVTEVNPANIDLLMERFISRERGEPPDIDVDFEHERREEIIQYIYAKYGRERAALAATVIRYRGKSAMRDVARAMGLPEDQVNRLTQSMAWQRMEIPLQQRLAEQGFDPHSPLLRRILTLAQELTGKPRHLSQHVGGFVISHHALSELVPVENAAMADRTIIQWDKDDLDRMKLLKVDCLALGMLSCVRRCLALVERHRGQCHSLASLTQNTNDQATYEMIQRADTIGVFQIESRAQMAMLPRHRPANFYDLVIQVAIVRPGPIQGDMVHPYLRRRRGEEAVEYPTEALRLATHKTLGVPLFQEQVMRIVMVAADYSPGEADQLRRDMAAWKRHGGLESHRERIFSGMQKNGYAREFAERIFQQILGFGSYGFPESHAASFSNLVYVSAWLKRHEPAAFACALLNSQPMGFYSPHQIVQDARRHDIQVRPIDVRYSQWDSSLEADAKSHGGLAIRLGLRQVQGLHEGEAGALLEARQQAPFENMADVSARSGVERRTLELLAEAGALRGLAGHRYRAHWQVAGIEPERPLLGRRGPEESHAPLPVPTVHEDVLADYARTRLSLGTHPLAQLRARLSASGHLGSQRLQRLGHNRPARMAGIVTMRQRPQTASGVTFLTLEDEHGWINVVVWRRVAEHFHRALLEARLLVVEGRWETVDGVGHLIARRLLDRSDWLDGLDVRSRDFH